MEDSVKADIVRHNINRYMVRGLRLLLGLLLVLCWTKGADWPETNPYYVDVGSVKNYDYNTTLLLKNHNQSAGTSNEEVMVAKVVAKSWDAKVLELKITNASGDRWEAPLFNPSPGTYYRQALFANMGFLYNEDPFEFMIRDPSTTELLVHSAVAKGGSLRFFDKYLEIGLWYPSNRIFGLPAAPSSYSARLFGPTNLQWSCSVGERVTRDFELCTQKEKCIYTLFSKDEGSPYDNGTGGNNIYGVHPFYLVQLPSQGYLGVLSLNSNNQDANITRRSDGTSNVYHKMVGGIFDLYFFFAGTAEATIQKYHDLVGRPYLPPFWSLGFHMCRYGWKNLSVVKDVVARFEEADLPLDVVWGDIDYMDGFADFTIDPVNYTGLEDFVRELHQRHMRWVPIIDAGLKYDINNKYYILGEKYHVFIQSAWTKKTLVGRVWPGAAVFLSWYCPYAKNLWHEGLSDLHTQVKFDGIWLDMNEPSNFCKGECPETFSHTPNSQEGTEGEHDPEEFKDLPYFPGGADPEDKTLSMSGYHCSTNDFEDATRKEHNTHSLWGTLEGRETAAFFTEKLRERPFVLTRSTFPGAGMWTSKWLGDNHSSWESMRYSIVGSFNFQLFGIPHIGADICGFFGTASKELCGRWLQLGAFYPFSRSHHGGTGQEPYVFSAEITTAARNALRQRYSILRYLHTKLFEVALLGGTVMRPLFFDYPFDPEVYAETGRCFLLGGSLLVVPALEANLKELTIYLPNKDWYDVRTRVRVRQFDPGRTAGGNVTLPAGFDFVNVLVVAGSIVPYQDAVAARVRRTQTLQYLPLELLIVPDNTGMATGTLIVDDESSPLPLSTGAYLI